MNTLVAEQRLGVAEGPEGQGQDQVNRASEKTEVVASKAKGTSEETVDPHAGTAHLESMGVDRKTAV